MSELMLFHGDMSVRELMESGVVLLTFLAALGAGIAWVYKKIVIPIHTKIERIWEVVNYELQSNGGRSLVDQVTYIAQNHREVAEDAKRIAKRLEDYQEAMKHRLDKIEAGVFGKEL